MTPDQFTTLATERRCFHAALLLPQDPGPGRVTMEGMALALWHEPKRPDQDWSVDGWRILIGGGPTWQSRLVQLDDLTYLDSVPPYDEEIPPVTMAALTPAECHPTLVLEFLALAMRTDTRLRMRYAKVGGGPVEEREITPIGIRGDLILGKSTPALLFAHDHGKDATRSFRIDHIQGIAPAGPRVPRWDGASYTMLAEVAGG